MVHKTMTDCYPDNPIPWLHYPRSRLRKLWRKITKEKKCACQALIGADLNIVPPAWVVDVHTFITSPISIGFPHPVISESKHGQIHIHIDIQVDIKVGYSNGKTGAIIGNPQAIYPAASRVIPCIDTSFCLSVHLKADRATVTCAANKRGWSDRSCRSQ